jgi:glycosyltransferase involved in cell wall biosynthesis/predicted Zn-dependent protease
MARHFLFGPVTADFADQTLVEARQRGDCLSFGYDAGADLPIKPQDTWQSIQERLPGNWRPEFAVLWLAYSNVPPGLWEAPVPVVGLAADHNLLWHYYRHVLPLCDLVLTDTRGAASWRHAGLEHVQAGNLFGAEKAFLEEMPGSERDIDVLFVGSLCRAVQRQRLTWLGRLAGLGDRWRVHIQNHVLSEEYRKLLRRARVVFNQSIRGECNRRVFEAISGGALLFQEAGNIEVEALLRDGHEYVAYTADNLETLLEYYLEHEEERRAIAAAAQAKLLPSHSFARLFDDQLAHIERAWPELVERASRRERQRKPLSTHARIWQAVSSVAVGELQTKRDFEKELVQDPRNGDLHNGLGVLRAVEAIGASREMPLAEIIDCFRQAVTVDPGHALAGLNLAEALVAAGQTQPAIAECRRVLELLRCGHTLRADVLDSAHFPPLFDLFRVEWERAAWQNAGQPAAEARAKLTLLRWRLHTLAASLTEDLAHYYETAVQRPDLPITRAALGCALARAGKPADAVPHLEEAVHGNPFDVPAARALCQAYVSLGLAQEKRRLAHDRRLLAKAAPNVVPVEAWFTDDRPAADELASIIILCCNQLKYTRECLESVLRYTHNNYELLLIDNGSTDETPAYLDEVRRRPGPSRVVVIRNQKNLGFAAGCNQGLAQSLGRYLVLLNNDTVVTAGWLDGLVAWSVHNWPKVGLVGPMTSWASPPQQIPVDYGTPEELQAFAAKRRQTFAGRGVHVERLIGFCMLFRREVWEQLGGLDENFGVGFFEDDDLCVRVREAGFDLLMALDVFVHHYGNRTFIGLGIDARAQLDTNFEKFRAKWGNERCAGYRMPRDQGVRETLPAPSTARVSLCMIVKNEEKNLAQCLRSVADLVHEMIVVDTGSADRTKEVAAECGAKVFDFAWVDSFAAARNESLRQAAGDWILWLDGDEFVDDTNRQRLKKLIADLKDANQAFFMRQFSKLEAAPHAAAQVDQVRMFRNRPDIRWEYRVHEQILPAIRRAGGDIVVTDIVIEHTGFRDPAIQGPKVDRNLRLLELELADRPGDAFVLYNLGSVKMTQGHGAEALEYFGRSLANLAPSDHLARKLHALRARTLQQLGRRDEVLAACRAGLQAFPEDGELLFWQAIVLREHKDLDGAVACLQRILQAKAPAHFTSVDAGLYGYRTRNLLAEIYLEQGYIADAEKEWKAVVAECPGFPAAWFALVKVYASQGRWQEALDALPHAEKEPQMAIEALVLRGQALLGLKRYSAAQQALKLAIEQAPAALRPRVLLSHALLQEGRNWAAAERALQDVLELDPAQAEAAHNLARLRADNSNRLGAVVAAAKTDVGVSLSMIVRNEEDNIAACLDGIADLVDEMIVVDTGSTDRTKEIAAARGAKVFDFPWVDSFAAARNESLRHATGQWILWLDADDRVDAENRERLRRLFASLKDDNAAYAMKCYCLADAQDMETEVDHLRLFRNRADVRWTFRVHEQILPAIRATGGEVRWSDVVIQHIGYQNPVTRKRKLERDIRLLEQELHDRPGHPFALFNLGSVYHEMGRRADALEQFKKSLAASVPSDSIVRKLYAAITQCSRHLGKKEEALQACREGLALFPDDIELVFQQGVVLRDLEDIQGAIASWERCLTIRPGAHFASINAGLKGPVTRHNLAASHRELGQNAEAESYWKAALDDRPGYEPAWRGLMILYLEQQRWQDLEWLAHRLETDVPDELTGNCVRARACLARKEFDVCKEILDAAIRKHPRAPEPRIVLTHCLLQEGTDWGAAEKALRELLEIDPTNAEAMHNLSVLLQQNRSTKAEQGGS